MTTIALLQAVHSASADMVHKKLLQRTKVRECSEMFASFHSSILGILPRDILKSVIETAK